jgi:hypothetical protein
MTPLKSYGGDSESESDKVKQTLAGHRYQLLKATRLAMTPLTRRT